MRNSAIPMTKMTISKSELLSLLHYIINQKIKIMKKFLFIAVVACFLFSACGGNKGEEQNKTIAASSVKKSGVHSDLLNVSGEVKILLVKVSDDGWAINAIIPVQNAGKWSEVPDTDENASRYYKPSMGNLSVEFLDANGAVIDYDVDPDWSVVESVLPSEETKTEDMMVKPLWNRGIPYKEALEKYNKIQGISLKKMELSQVYSASGSSSSSSSSSSDDDDDDDVDYDEELDKAVDSYNKAVKAASKTLDAYKDLYDALDD